MMMHVECFMALLLTQSKERAEAAYAEGVRRRWVQEEALRREERRRQALLEAQSKWVPKWYD